MSNPNFKSKTRSDLSKPAFINKSRQDFRNELLNLARKNFSDKISDFSDMSLGGMFLDFAAVVGESLTNYLDYQINELDYEKATSEYNIINHLRKAGIDSNMTSPSSVSVDFYIFAAYDETTNIIHEERLPCIKKYTTLESEEGIKFVLMEDVDFTQGGYEIINNVLIGDTPYLTIKKGGICSSGEVTEETFFFEDDDTEDFLTASLSNDNVTSIISVFDNSLTPNEYKEVEFLSQDTVYEKVENSKQTTFKVIPAPFRFVKEVDFDSGLTSIRFGNGNNRIYEESVYTNPEEMTLPLLGRNYTNMFSLDPKKLISSESLGVSPAGRNITVRYKHGGGLEHNVQEESIKEILDLKYTFPLLDEENAEYTAIRDTVIASLSVINDNEAIGGTDPLPISDLRNMIPEGLKSQSRIVTHEDLIARLYTMPSDFGRVSKVAIIDNPYTKNSRDIYLTCKNNEDNYINASDAIKSNISSYLNEYRLIGDSFNIIDAKIYNFKIFLKIKVSSKYDPTDVVNNVKALIFSQSNEYKDLEIGEGINVNDIVARALNTPGVLTVTSNFKTIIRSVDFNTSASYSNNRFSSYEMYEDGIVYPPRGGIFELKSPDDIEIINS